MRRLAAGLVGLAALGAAADEGAYQAIVGPGVAVRSFTTPFTPQTSVLVESIYGLTDRWNWEAPIWFDFTARRLTFSFGTGVELVWLRLGRFQCNLGAGVFAAVPVSPAAALELGPYFEVAARWKIIWGIGVGIELHAGYAFAVDGAAGAPMASLVLAVHSEL